LLLTDATQRQKKQGRQPLLLAMQRKGKRRGNLCFWLCTFAFDYPLLLATGHKAQKAKGNAKAKDAKAKGEAKDNISAQMQPHNTKIFFHTRCRAINRIGPHNTDIISTIFGLLLGDGYAINRTGEGVRISIKQSIIHKEYLFSLYEFFFLRGYCSNLIPRKYNRTIKGINKIYSGYEFNTFTFRSFVLLPLRCVSQKQRWIYNSFYKKGKKKKITLFAFD
jgi:hypothetical protein